MLFFTLAEGIARVLWSQQTTPMAEITIDYLIIYPLLANCTVMTLLCVSLERHSSVQAGHFLAKLPPDEEQNRL